MDRPAYSRNCLIFFASLIFIGCNSGTYPVTGTVTFEDGQPVEDARIVFRTRHDGQHLTAFATSDENGEYSLTTWQSGDGAVPGEHVVIVTKPRQPREDEQGKRSQDAAGDDLLPPEIHDKFASYETTPLKATVEKKENEINLTVERPE